MVQSFGHRPTIVCLSGSTRFREVFQNTDRNLTLSGHVVLSCGVFAHAEGLTLTDQDKADLDALHLAKIDLADRCVRDQPRWIHRDTYSGRDRLCPSLGSRWSISFRPSPPSSTRPDRRTPDHIRPSPGPAAGARSGVKAFYRSGVWCLRDTRA